MNRPIRETSLGQWMKRNVPLLLDEVGDVLPDQGVLGVVKKLVDGKDYISENERAEFDRLLNHEIQAAQEATKRWEADLQGDAHLAKVIRPLALIVTLGLFFVVLILDSIQGIGFHVSDAFAGLLETLALTICGAYFAGRTLEKTIRR